MFQKFVTNQIYIFVNGSLTTTCPDFNMISGIPMKNIFNIKVIMLFIDIYIIYFIIFTVKTTATVFTFC